MRILPLLLLLLADTSGRREGVRETVWGIHDFVWATNDPTAVLESTGDVVSVQIQARGESCLLRHRRYPLRLPCRIRARVRWTAKNYEAEYPTLNVIFDPPFGDDPWWRSPIDGAAMQGVWRNGLVGFVFHWSGNDDWKRFGMSESVETAPLRHGWRAQKGQWAWIEITLERKKITVHADGAKVAECEADLSKRRAFAFGIGDQSSTRVEMDEFRIAW